MHRSVLPQKHSRGCSSQGVSSPILSKVVRRHGGVIFLHKNKKSFGAYPKDWTLLCSQLGLIQATLWAKFCNIGVSLYELWNPIFVCVNTFALSLPVRLFSKFEDQVFSPCWTIFQPLAFMGLVDLWVSFRWIHRKCIWNLIHGRMRSSFPRRTLSFLQTQLIDGW